MTMSIEEHVLAGLFVIRPEPKRDARGFFLRTYCRKTLLSAGIDFVPAQSSQSHNEREGTLRGLHFQRPPHMEDKIVRCIRGAMFDAAVDIRPGSADFGRWAGLKLSEANGLALFIPKGFAHGFQTLAPETVVQYDIAPAYVASHAAGVRWDDPRIGIVWPQAAERIVSRRDAALPLLSGLSS
jgi:dTDP-4-dehydrorhamnose 3,5-epimerase